MGVVSALAWVFVAAASGYDLEDPYGEHTKQAIAYDGQGRMEDSRRAFAAAARFTPSTSTHVNLGVCTMRAATASRDRAEKNRLYHRAYESMRHGGALAVLADDVHLYEENMRSLLKNFELEKVPLLPGMTMGEVPPPADPQMCGAPPPDAVGLDEEVPVAPSMVRSFLEHQRAVPIAGPLPRVSAFEIDVEPKYAKYVQRADPFILTDAMATWRAPRDASRSAAHAWRWLQTLADRWYLTRLPRAVRELAIPASPDQSTNGSAFRYEEGRGAMNPGRYMHLQLSPAQWAELEADGSLAAKRHWHLRNDAWLDDCLGVGTAVKDEYHFKTHWKIILAGVKGAGMFNHSDSLQTSSWHAYVCGQLSTGERKCFEDQLEAGEILYYGRGWSHETQNLETPTVTLTDTAVHKANWEAVAERLHAECATEAMNFRLSGELCDALDACFETLSRIHTKSNKRPPPPWRSVTTSAILARRAETTPHDTNYDGRNHITEP